MADKEALAKRIKETQDQGGAVDSATSGQLMQLGSTLSRLETQALDKNAGYIEAKVKYAEALKTLDAFKLQIDEVCKADPEYVAADQALQQALQSEQQAKDTMLQTQKTEMAARAAEAKARSEASKSKSTAGQPR
jgi:hypothetical protein